MLKQSRHLDNYGSNEYEPDIRYGIETFKKLLESLGNRAAPTDQNRLVILCVEHCPLQGGRGGHGSDGADLSTSYLRGTASCRSQIN
jgi:hypothetical protein